MISGIGPDFGGDAIAVGPEAMTLMIDGDVKKVDVCNVIPAMKAGRIAQLAGITEGNWAPVNAVDLSSKTEPNIHVLGDRWHMGICPNWAVPPTVRPRYAPTRWAVR